MDLNIERSTSIKICIQTTAVYKVCIDVEYNIIWTKLRAMIYVPIFDRSFERITIPAQKQR